MYLFPTDGSDPSRNAEDGLIRLLDSNNQTLHILGVIEEEPNPFASPDVKADYETELIEQAEDVVNSSAHRLRDKGFEVDTEVLHGNPGPVICERSDELLVDGIIMGRRGLGTASELLLGSVSHYVMHHSNRPITLVPSENT